MATPISPIRNKTVENDDYIRHQVKEKEALYYGERNRIFLHRVVIFLWIISGFFSFLSNRNKRKGKWEKAMKRNGSSNFLIGVGFGVLLWEKVVRDKK